MSGIPHEPYEPKTGIERWLHSRLPIVALLHSTLTIPTPKNLNWMWIWGIVLTVCLAMQIITGIVLVMHYTPHVDLSFDSSLKRGRSSAVLRRTHQVNRKEFIRNKVTQT